MFYKKIDLGQHGEEVNTMKKALVKKITNV